MNKYVFYIDDECNKSSKNNKCENIQFLGIEKGKSQFEAKQKLISEKKLNFEESTIKSKQLFSEDNKKEIKTVIEYLWEDEKKHFEENDCPSNHIFFILKKLKELVAE